MESSEFKAISVKFDEKRGIFHQIFLKQHKIREEKSEIPSDLTVFVCNIPPYCSEECLKFLFGMYGSILLVRFIGIDSPYANISKNSQLPVSCQLEIQGYRTGYIVFKSVASLQTVLSWENGKVLCFPSDHNTLITGLKKWCVQYNAKFPDSAKMQMEVDLYMAQHDQKEKELNIFAKNVIESNEDGWIPVSKRSRNPGFARKKSVKDKVLTKMNRKKKKKALLNFYSFQIKESKMNHLVTLRKKFEEDKKKLEALKTQRKFKPL